VASKSILKRRRAMEHKPLRDLSHVADVVPETPKLSLTRRKRLERWIEVLGHEPGRALNTLREIEHKPRDARRASRVDNSPLTVAYNDPVLRADGLASDRLGDAVDYFELSDEEAHRVFCSCLYGESMTAGSVAARLRSMTKVNICAPIAIWAVCGVAIAIPLLAKLWG
jgi:hypothetical protein